MPTGWSCRLPRAARAGAVAGCRGAGADARLPCPLPRRRLDAAACAVDPAGRSARTAADRSRTGRGHLRPCRAQPDMDILTRLCGHSPQQTGEPLDRLVSTRTLGMASQPGDRRGGLNCSSDRHEGVPSYCLAGTGHDRWRPAPGKKPRCGRNNRRCFVRTICTQRHHAALAAPLPEGWVGTVLRSASSRMLTPLGDVQLDGKEGAMPKPGTVPPDEPDTPAVVASGNRSIAAGGGIGLAVTGNHNVVHQYLFFGDGRPAVPSRSPTSVKPRPHANAPTPTTSMRTRCSVSARHTSPRVTETRPLLISRAQQACSKTSVSSAKRPRFMPCLHCSGPDRRHAPQRAGGQSTNGAGRAGGVRRWSGLGCRRTPHAPEDYLCGCSVRVALCGVPVVLTERTVARPVAPEIRPMRQSTRMTMKTTVRRNWSMRAELVAPPRPRMPMLPSRARCWLAVRRVLFERSLWVVGAFPRDRGHRLSCGGGQRS